MARFSEIVHEDDRMHTMLARISTRINAPAYDCRWKDGNARLDERLQGSALCIIVGTIAECDSAISQK